MTDLLLISLLILVKELETQALSRDELLKISGKGIETFAQNIVSGKHLTPDDEKLLKRQKRLEHFPSIGTI